jgi:hypothetical protein
MNELFTTLGLMSGILISSVVAVPMVSYYNGNNLAKWDFLNPNYWSKRTDESKLKLRVDGDLFVDGDIRCSGDVLAYFKRKET